MNRKNGMIRTFSFLLMGAIVFHPLQVYASDSKITQQQTFTTTKNSEEEFAEYINFDKKLKLDGKTYELEGISYEVLSEKHLDKREKVVDSDVIEEGQAYSPPKTIKEDGLTYTLLDTKTERKTIEESFVQTVTTWDDYDYAVTATQVPATKVMTAVNERTGQQVEVTCSLTGIRNEGTTTSNNEMAITYENYDAAYYEWNGNLIPRNDERPALSGYEEQLLEAVNAGEGSRITGLSWSGEPYQNAEGVLCREAVATVQQIIPVYRANYRGTIVQEEKKGLVYKSTYSADDPEGQMEYEVQATAAYTQNVVLPYILVGIGIFITLAVFVAVLMILSKKKKET